MADAGPPYTTSAPDLEDASLFARRVVLGGTDSRNQLHFAACDAKLRGRGGADTIARSYDSLFESVFCPRFPQAHLNGGRGKDDLEGTVGRDVLLGGSGKDLLDGGVGSDRLIGGSGPDELRGTNGDDVLLGGRAGRAARTCAAPSANGGASADATGGGTGHLLEAGA